MFWFEIDNQLEYFSWVDCTTDSVYFQNQLFLNAAINVTLMRHYSFPYSCQLEKWNTQIIVRRYEVRSIVCTKISAGVYVILIWHCSTILLSFEAKTTCEGDHLDHLNASEIHFVNLPHEVKTQYVHFRLHAKYFLLPWKIPSKLADDQRSQAITCRRLPMLSFSWSSKYD